MKPRPSPQYLGTQYKYSYIISYSGKRKNLFLLKFHLSLTSYNCTMDSKLRKCKMTGCTKDCYIFDIFFFLSKARLEDCRRSRCLCCVPLLSARPCRLHSASQFSCFTLQKQLCSNWSDKASPSKGRPG